MICGWQRASSFAFVSTLRASAPHRLRSAPLSPALAAANFGLDSTLHSPRSATRCAVEPRHEPEEVTPCAQVHAALAAMIRTFS